MNLSLVQDTSLPRPARLEKVDANVLVEIERRALEEASIGAEQIAIKRLIEEVSADMEVSVNNSHASAVSDWLISRHAQLAPLIERRSRGAKGNRSAQVEAPPPARSGLDLLVELVGLLEVIGLEIASITLRASSGQEYTITRGQIVPEVPRAS